MNEQRAEKKRRRKNLNPPRGVGRAAKNARRYPPELRIKAVRLRLEEGFSPEEVCAELGMARSGLNRWIQLYRQFGEAGLQRRVGARREPKLAEPITRKIVELKGQYPSFGVKRISQLLRRWFFLTCWNWPCGAKVYYVGRTGDSSSRHAQSPFARLSQHLGSNKNSNSLRTNLKKKNLVAQECSAFQLFAHGPIFPEGRDDSQHKRFRDIVAALEKALAEAMDWAGYPMLNEVRCRKPLDPSAWRKVLPAFRKHFHALGHSHPSRPTPQPTSTAGLDRRCLQRTNVPRQVGTKSRDIKWR
jgi:transposase-like protein